MFSSSTKILDPLTFRSSLYLQFTAQFKPLPGSVDIQLRGQRLTEVRRDEMVVPDPGSPR